MNKEELALEKVREALAALAIETNKPPSERTFLKDEQAELIRKTLERMAHQLEQKSLPPAKERERSLGRIICDSWPLDCRLGELLIDAENTYRLL